MAATLDLLEAKKRETFAVLRADEQGQVSMELRVARLEKAMGAVYKWAIQQSKNEMRVQEVFDLWDKMVSVCDFFIDHVRDIADGTPCSASFDGLLDLRLACDEKRQFHRVS